MPELEVSLRFIKSEGGRGLLPEVSVLDAADEAGVNLAWECRAGICGQCKVRCLTGTVAMESRDALSGDEEARGLILACQALPRSETIEIDA
ncbi:MAG: 2Fe-2S iron-sulfur cluster binding domain-containing protein [Pirellulaceae bacterium]